VLALGGVKASAAVFDLDGTLVDNIAYHLEAWVALARSEGVELTAERFARELSGMKTSETIPLLLGRELAPDAIARLAAQKEAHYRALYGPHRSFVPGAEALLRGLRGRGLKVAIASAAPPENRAFVLEGLGAAGLFDAVVGGEDAPRGKPFPDLFLAAARAVGVPPERCVAFEDAPLGVRAARAASMRVAAVTTTSAEGELRDAGAEWVVADFERLPEGLLGLLGLA
jgi:beta-phosphoglucomutase